MVLADCRPHGCDTRSSARVAFMRSSMPRGRAAWLAVALIGTGMALALSLPGRATGASPDPGGSSSITISAEPMLGGTFRSGSWAAVRVLLENTGPTVDGELRISNTATSASTFNLPVQLAPGARQEHVVYGQTGPFGSRLTIALVGQSTVLASVTLAVDVVASSSLAVYVVAERPQALAGDLGVGASRVGPAPKIVTIKPEDLPPRAEAWSSVDVLVWQDVDSNRLASGQMEALRTWLATGGTLVILGGSTGTATLGAFPADLLPFVPTTVIDASPSDLAALLGELPPGASTALALAGTLGRGTVLARSGDSVVAARVSQGRGSVAVIGIDPSTPWLAGSSTASGLWTRLLPSGPHGLEGSAAENEGSLVDALSNLPAVRLPGFEQLFILIVAYVIAVGPLNYLLLRRRDRREWAWITIPATMLVFAIATYGLGALQKGGDVIVNQLAVVHGAVGSDRGLGRVHIGVFSPNRGTFDVAVGGGALLSAPSANRFDGTVQRPLDVVFGETATVRDYGVGFGALRGFRAEAALAAPRTEAQLTLADDGISGTVTNASGMQLQDVSLVYGAAAALLGDMEPGESSPVELSLLPRDEMFEPLAHRMFPDSAGADPARAQSMAARRAMVQSLFGYWNEFEGGSVTGFASAPVILAWESGPTLPVDVGTPTQQVGERLFVLPARVSLAGPAALTGLLIQYSTISIDAIEGSAQGDFFYLDRGTLTVEYRPVEFEGSFNVTGLSLRLGTPDALTTAGSESLAPLPVEEQPDPDQPLASEPRPDAPIGDPRIQLFDRVLGTWVEFEPIDWTQTWRIDDPDRYVDRAGAFRVRFVVRERNVFAEFALLVRLEGTVE